MKKFYFTFGQGHAHAYGGYTFDKDCVVEIEAINSREARKQMFDAFDDKWAFQYDNLKDLSLGYFPRGVVDISGKAVAVL